MKRYVYPDLDDRLTSSFIHKYESKEGYWKRSEDYIVRVMKRYIKNHIFIKDRVLLDAGCGVGRLIPTFEGMFSKIYAVEPDNKRFNDAQKTVESSHLSNKVVCLNELIGEVNIEEKVDVVICSHVFQHIVREEVERIIRKFNEVVSDQGILFILTSFSGRKEDYYSKQRMVNSIIAEEEILKEEFDKIINEGEKCLPIHFFTKASIFEILDTCNFDVVDFRKYHKVGVNNKFRDILVVAKKKGSARA